MITSFEWMTEGDSLARGIADAAGLQCDAVEGRMPHEVQAVIEAAPPALFANRSVILSTGLSNNPDGRAHVKPQIDALVKAGARRVVVIGVGSGVRQGTNEWLAKLVTDMALLNVVFVGPLPVGGLRPGGIHPYSYDQLVDQINQLYPLPSGRQTLERTMANDTNLEASIDQLTAAFNTEKQLAAKELHEAVAAAQAAQQAQDQVAFDRAAARVKAIAEQLAAASTFTPSGNVPAAT